MSEPKPLLSIIIVHYRTPRLLLACIKSILQDTYDGPLEILVVDNGGLTPPVRDDLKKLPNVQCIDTGYNAGFARANNVGIRLAKGKYILLINPDSTIVPGFLSTMVTNYQLYEKKEKLGLMGCRIINPENGHVFEYGSGRGFYRLQHILRQNPLYIWALRKRNTKKTYTAQKLHYVNHFVDFVSGACVMVNKEVLIKENHFKSIVNLKKIIQKAIKTKKIITVEVENINQLKKIFGLKFKRVLFDNMSNVQLKKCLKLCNKKYETEYSGNANLNNIRKISKTGVQRISVGSITHSSKSFDSTLLI